MVKQKDRAEAIRLFNYPFPAIEEALVNAVYHRSYEQQEPVEVRINPDRIEIVSYPGPDASIRIEALNGYIELTLPGKPQSRKQKYRITEKGRTAIAK